MSKDPSNTLEAEEEAYRARNPSAGRPRIWCDEPPLGTTKYVANQFRLSGWAFSPRGIGGVHVEVAGREFAAHYGLHRPDVAQAFPGEGMSDQTGWMLRLETSTWPPGEYEARITARDRDGGKTSIRRVVKVDPRAAYRSWREHRRLSLPGLAAARRFLDEQKSAAPSFLVCLLCRDATADQLERTSRSLRDQLYPDWSLLRVGRGPILEDSGTPRPVADDEASSADDVAAALKWLLGSSADFAVFVQVGDLIAPHALLAIAEDVEGPEAPQLLYADEDVVLADGERVDPFFKPGWSPELLLSTDYVGPFVSVGREAARMALDVDPQPIDSPYELLLRLIDAEPRVKRIPDVLYSRDAQALPSGEEEAAGVGRLLHDVARRRGKRAQVLRLEHPGMRDVTWEREGEPRVSIVLATALAGDSLPRCLESIRDQTSYSNFEVVVVAGDSGDSPPPEPNLPGLDWRLVTYDGPFNCSAMKNFGAAASTGVYLLFVNDDTEVETRDWVERLLEQAGQPGIGAVGGKLIHPDGVLQLAGVLVLDGPPGARPIGAGFPGDEPGYRGLFAVTRNTSSVGAGCMLINRELFDSVSGFDEAFRLELGDVDLCLRVLKTGRRVVWTPRAVLRHREGTSQGANVLASDHSRFLQRWRPLLETGDPYYNPNLSTGFDDFELDYPEPEPASLSDDGDEERPSPERFVPETMDGLIKAEHEARYRWAATVVRGKDVLDAGCGVGYGAQIFSEAGAARVVGVDLSADAVADAEFRAGQAAQFLVGDLQSLPLPSASFDVVACFEAIEHVGHGDAVLDEFKRVLRPTGVLLVSSPNRAAYLPGNPYHIHEYAPAELEEALAQRFANVALYRQHPWVTSLITDDAGFATRSAAAEIEGSLRKVAAAQPGDEVYVLAAASDGPVPDLGGSAVMTDAFEVKAWYERVRALEKELSRLRKERRRFRHEITTREEALHALQASLSWRLTRPLRSAKALASRRLGWGRVSSPDR